MRMKLFLPLILTGLLLVSACSRKTNRLTQWNNTPGKTELTATRHVKLRSKQENRKRVEYFNSLQHKGNVKDL